MRAILKDPANQLIFSAASLCEIAIKCRLGRDDFWWTHGCCAVACLTTATANCPHKDPFDRFLVAQATVEGMTRLTADL